MSLTHASLTHASLTHAQQVIAIFFRFFYCFCNCNRLGRFLVLSPRVFATLALVFLAVILLVGNGCSRKFYRRQADRQTYAAISEKAHLVHEPSPGPPGGYSISPAPVSRLFDPYDPDHPPQPPDDPKSALLMDRVDHKKGYPHWEENGVLTSIENPNWQEALATYLPVGERNQLTMGRDEAVLVALVNSRDYQEELETLYLSALDVTFERFRFDTQFFDNNLFDYLVRGRDHPTTGGESSSLLTEDNQASATRLYATGAELVVNMANTIMWEFSGLDSRTAVTLLDFTFLQPLLREAGRAVVLERLTLSERVLLANVRAFERFRRGFYVDIVGGTGGVDGPSRRGGVFGGAGLTGFTGVGAGGFGQLALSGGGGATGAGAGQVGGFLGLLQDLQEIRNLRSNLVALRESLAQLEATFEAGRLSIVQVDQARQALLSAESQLLTAEAGFQDSFDNFKIELGLPPTVPLTLDDELLAPFELLSPELTAVRDALGELIERLRAESPRNSEQLASLAEELSQIRQEALDQIEQVEQDVEALKEILPERKETLEFILEIQDDSLSEYQQRIFSPEDLDDRVELLDEKLQGVQDLLDQSLAELEQFTERLEKGQNATPQDKQPDKPQQELLGKDQLDQDQPNKLMDDLKELLDELQIQLLELALWQAEARSETATLPAIRLSEQRAFALARCFRRDWKNARASLVDTWRLIEFNANDLLADLDVIVSGDIRSTDNELFNLQGTTGRLRLALQWDAPITRLAERNIYRESLIDYQDARRSYMLFTDRVKQGLRVTLRRIRRDLINFELRRAAINVAIRQVDSTREQLNQPPPPGDVGAAGGGLGATTSRDLLDALNDLLDVQNDFLSVYLNYEVQRLILDRDLGTMRLDCRGLWVDPGQFDYELPPHCADQEMVFPEIVLVDKDGRPVDKNGRPLPQEDPQKTSPQEAAQSGENKDDVQQQGAREAQDTREAEEGKTSEEGLDKGSVKTLQWLPLPLVRDPEVQPPQMQDTRLLGPQLPDPQLPDPQLPDPQLPSDGQRGSGWEAPEKPKQPRRGGWQRSSANRDRRVMRLPRVERE